MLKLHTLAAAAMLLVGTAAQASPAIVSFTGGSQFTGFSDDETVGWTFGVSGPGVVVSALGWWDANQDGLAASHQVGIWSTAGVLLGSATVMPSDPLTGEFRYAATTPFVLAGGQTYVIGGRDLVSDGDLYVTGTGALTMDPLITFLQAARTDVGAGFAFPGIFTANSGGRFGPNFLLRAVPDDVPEPGALALLGLGLAGLGVSRRRKA